MEWVGSRIRKAQGVSGQICVGKVSLSSFLGGRPVGMGIDIVTMGGICREYRSSDVHSAR